MKPNYPPPPYWEKLRALASAKGFSSLCDCLAAYPEYSFYDLSRMLDVAPAYIEMNQVYASLEAGRTRSIAMDTLRRSILHEFPKGWLLGDRYKMKRIMLYSAWIAALTTHTGFNKGILQGIVGHIENDPPECGWRPISLEDSYLVAVFDKLWPSTEQGTGDPKPDSLPA